MSDRKLPLYESGSRTIDGYGPLLRLESQDVFAPDRPAMVVAAASGEGKTVAALDMVYSNLDRVTGFTYVTNSYDTPTNILLRQLIPEIHVKNWDVSLLCRIWSDILQRSYAFSKSLEDRAVDQFLQGRCPNDHTLMADLASIDELVATNSNYFPDVEQGHMAIAAHKKQIKINFIRSHFRSDDRSLTPSELDIVRASKSSKPCYLLICDDVTAQLRNPPKDEIAVPFPGEGGNLQTRTMKGKDGLDFLLINILTLARHYGIFGFFVHTFDAFTPAVRSQFGGMMFLGADSISQACREQTLSPADKQLIAAAWDIAKGFPYHKVVLYPNPELTHHKQRVALIRPQYHTQPRPIGVPTFQAVMRNLSMRVAQFRGGEVHRARVEVEKKKRDDEAEALAREGSSDMTGSASTFGSMLDLSATASTSHAPIQLSLPMVPSAGRQSAPSGSARGSLDSLL